MAVQPGVEIHVTPKASQAEAQAVGVQMGSWVRSGLQKSIGSVRLPSLGAIDRQVHGTRVEFNQLTEASNDFGDSLTRGLRRIVALSAASAALFGIARAFKESLIAARDLEKTLQDINVILNLPSQQLAKFGKDLFDVARNTKQTFDEVGKAAVEFARQGLSVEETLKRTQAAMILVNLAGINAKDATETLTAAMNSFNKENLDAVQIINKIVAVDAKFAVSAADLAESLRRVGSTAQDSGVSFDRLISLTTAAQQVTQRGGSVIGNALKTIFQRLQRSETLDQLEQLGVQVRQVDDATGRFTGTLIPADQILKQLAERFKTLNQEQRAQVSEMVGGIYQGNIFRGILSGLEIEQKAYTTSLGATDEAIRRNAALLETQDAKYKQAGTTLRQVASNVANIGFGDFTKRTLDLFNENSIVKAFAGTGDEAGNEFAKIFIKAFSDVLLGPGIVFLGVVGIKIAQTLAKYSKSVMPQINPFGGEAQLNISKQITAFLDQNSQKIQQINATTASQAQKNAEILALFRSQTAELQKQAALAAEVRMLIAPQAPAIMRSTAVKPNIPAKFSGYIPSAADGLSEAMMRETVAISQGVGGAHSSAKAVFLPNFKSGYGVGAVANTSEYLVPNFAGSGKSAIFNRDMISALGMPNGATPIMAGGSIANFPGGVIPRAWLFKAGQQEAVKKFIKTRERILLLKEAGQPMIASALQEKLADEMFEYLEYMKKIGAKTWGYSHGLIPNFADPMLSVIAQTSGATSYLGLKDANNRNISLEQAVQKGLLNSSEAKAFLEYRDLAMRYHGASVKDMRGWMGGPKMSFTQFINKAKTESNRPRGFAFRESTFGSRVAQTTLGAPQDIRARAGYVASYIVNGPEHPIVPYQPRFPTGGSRIEVGGASVYSGPPNRRQLGYNPSLWETKPTTPLVSGSLTQSVPQFDVETARKEEMDRIRQGRLNRMGHLGFAAMFGAPLLAEGIGSYFSQMNPSQAGRYSRMASGVGQGAGMIGLGMQIASLGGTPGMVAGSAVAGIGVFTSIISVMGNFEESIEDLTKKFQDLSHASDQRIQTIQNARGGAQSVALAVEGGARGPELQRVMGAALSQTRNVENMPLRQALRKQILGGNFDRQTQDEINRLTEQALMLEQKRQVLSPENINLVNEEIKKGTAAEPVSWWRKAYLFGPKVPFARADLGGAGVSDDTVTRLATIRELQLRGRTSAERSVEARESLSKLGGILGTKVDVDMSGGGPSTLIPKWATTTYGYSQKVREYLGTRITKQQEEQLAILEKRQGIFQKRSSYEEEQNKALGEINKLLGVERAALQKVVEDTDQIQKAQEEGNNIVQKTITLRRAVLETVLANEERMNRSAINTGIRNEAAGGLRAANLEASRMAGVSDLGLRNIGLSQQIVANRETLQIQTQGEIQRLISAAFQGISGGAQEIVSAGQFNDKDRQDVRNLLNEFGKTDSISSFNDQITDLIDKLKDTAGVEKFVDNLRGIQSDGRKAADRIEGLRTTLSNTVKISTAQLNAIKEQRLRDIESPIRTGKAGSLEAELGRIQNFGQGTDFFKVATDTKRGESERAFAAQQALAQLEDLRQRDLAQGGGLITDIDKFNAEFKKLYDISNQPRIKAYDEAKKRLTLNPVGSEVLQQGMLNEIRQQAGTGYFELSPYKAGRLARQKPWVDERDLYYNEGFDREGRPIRRMTGQNTANARRNPEYVKGAYGVEPYVAPLAAALKNALDPITQSLLNFDKSPVVAALNNLANTNIKGTMTGTVTLELSEDAAGFAKALGEGAMQEIKTKLADLEIKIGAVQQEKRLGSDRPLPPIVAPSMNL